VNRFGRWTTFVLVTGTAILLVAPNPAIAQVCLELVGGSTERAPFTSAVASPHHLYVADADRKLRVFDISVPAAPREVSSIRTSGHPIDITLSGQQLVLTENDFATYVFDVTDPTAPVERGRHVTPPAAQSVAINGDRAYLANFSSGLTILDLSNPAKPLRMSTLDTPGFSYGVAYYRGHALLGDLTGGLRVVDVSRPNKPREVATLPELRRASDLVAYEDIAYVAGGTDGIALVDIHDPRNPTLLGAVHTSDTAQQRQVLAVADDTLLVGDDHLWLFDLTNPRRPRLVDSLELPVESDTTAIAVTDNHVFVTGSTSGFLVFERTACHAIVEDGRLKTATGVAEGAEVSSDIDTGAPAARR
jgi:hypothetical protein